MTRSEILAAGGVEEAPAQMTRAEILAAGGREEQEDQAVGQDAPGGTFLVNALDSLSVSGVPSVLGAGDAIMGKPEEGFVDRVNQMRKAPMNLLAQVATDPKALLERYYKNKDEYAAGKERLDKENPKSALGGALATFAVPGGAALKGAKLAQVAKRGAATGALYGGARGDAKTLDGEIGETVVDAGVGGLVGAGTAGVGYGVGKAIGAPLKWASNKAKEGLDRFRGNVEERVRSDIGGFNQVQGEGIGGLMNEGDRVAKVQDLLAQVAQRTKNGRGQGPLEDKLMLAQRALEAARRAQGPAIDNLNKFGGHASPDPQKLFAGHAKDLEGELNKRIVKGGKDALVAGAAFKVNPMLGAAVAGSKYGGIRDAARAISEHPKLMAKVLKLAPVQQALARFGGKAGAQPKMINSVVYALRDHPEVKRALEDPEEQTEPVALSQ